ncbi:hypothetical protein NUW54_g14532 [Trametes sanguinea]|uniref:Uncharacterized protein n=1 Tax=Trametes sanguinea TaxID=158606 RepID=A0ACC1MCA9_9APHY|nr:hypothetical protein NUW54_g14532 [Trametes sanguinea]
MAASSTTVPSLYDTVILLGCCSGVSLGKVTVRTPLSMDALISSGCNEMRTGSERAAISADRRELESERAAFGDQQAHFNDTLRQHDAAKYALAKQQEEIRGRSAALDQQESRIRTLNSSMRMRVAPWRRSSRRSRPSAMQSRNDKRSGGDSKATRGDLSSQGCQITCEKV